LEIEYKGIVEDHLAAKDVFAKDIVEEQGKADDENGQVQGEKSDDFIPTLRRERIHHEY
jgi:hypothetical protein